MRPALNPALRPLWRDGDTLQLGLDPRRAVVLEGVHPALGRFLTDLNGRDPWPEAVARAGDFGVPAAEAERVLCVLQRAGAIVDRSLDEWHRDGIISTERDRLAPDVAAWSLVGRDPAAASRTLRRRRSARLLVVGAGRVGAQVARLVAAAGIGEVTVTDDGLARWSDLSPGGLDETAVGHGRGAQVRRVVVGSYPSTARSRTRRSAGTVLTLLCPVDRPPDRSVVEQHTADGTPHLSAALVENVGTVGPLVLPGASPCLRCLDLHRVDRDPSWPLLVAQLTGRPPAGFVAPSDVALAAAVAAHASLAALAYVDAPTRAHPLLGAVVELGPRGEGPNRRAFGTHPACGCRWLEPEPIGQLRPTADTMGT